METHLKQGLFDLAVPIPSRSHFVLHKCWPGFSFYYMWFDNARPFYLRKRKEKLILLMQVKSPRTFHEQIPVSSGIHSPLLHHSCRNKPEPVHMHWTVHSSLIPGDRTYEDNPCVDPWVPLLRQRRPQPARRPRNGSCSCRNGLVWECLLQTWG